MLLFWAQDLGCREQQGFAIRARARGFDPRSRGQGRVFIGSQLSAHVFDSSLNESYDGLQINTIGV